MPIRINISLQLQTLKSCYANIGPKYIDPAIVDSTACLFNCRCFHHDSYVTSDLYRWWQIINANDTFCKLFTTSIQNHRQEILFCFHPNSNKMIDTEFSQWCQLCCRGTWKLLTYLIASNWIPALRIYYRIWLLCATGFYGKKVNFPINTGLKWQIGSCIAV